MEIVTAKMSHLLNLGRQGEHLARRVRFTEPAAWAAAYGAGTAQLLVCRPGEAEPYPAALEEEPDGAWTWTVTGTDTALPGRGRCQLVYLRDDTVVKSAVWDTAVLPSLGEAATEAPEPQQTWVDQVLAAGTDARDAGAEATDAAARAEASAALAESFARRAEEAATGTGSGNLYSSELRTLRVLDRAEYEALAVKDPGTLYLIRG